MNPKQVFVDAVGVTGLGSLGAGLYMLRPWTAFVVLGILLLLFSVSASRGRKE